MSTTAEKITRSQALWSADDFDRACDAGVFGQEARLELIHGRITERMGQGPMHSSLAAYFADCLRAALTPRWTVREERAIRIAFDGEPIPDITVVIGRQLDYRTQHPMPSDVLLLVEVAVSSEERDLGEKALLYAQAGIADYWVVLPESQQIVVHRLPSSNGYLSVTANGLGQTLTPLAAPDVFLAVTDLLGETGSRP
jgi:Uma2 family endonuclease